MYEMSKSLSVQRHFIHQKTMKTGEQTGKSLIFIA
jgi:hypothetical protein